MTPVLLLVLVSCNAHGKVLNIFAERDIAGYVDSSEPRMVIYPACNDVSNSARLLSTKVLVTYFPFAPYTSSCSFDDADLLEPSASLSALPRYVRMHEWWYLISLAIKSTSASFVVIVIMLSSSSATAAVRIASDFSGTSQFPRVSRVPLPVDLDTALQKRQYLGIHQTYYWVLIDPH